MKKKLFFVIATILLCALCLAACDSYASSVQDIAELLKVNYSSVTLNITTTTSGVTLKGTYKLTFEEGKTTVDYDFYRFNELSVDNDNAEGYQTRVMGSAVVQDGYIVEGDQSVQLPNEINFNGISFKQAFFSNCTTTSTKFEGTVVNPKGFTGNQSLVCSDMRVKVLYSKEALSQIAITYVSEKGSDVSVIYLITK